MVAALQVTGFFSALLAWSLWWSWVRRRRTKQIIPWLERLRAYIADEEPKEETT